MFKNMKLATKLISAFVAVCVLGAVVSAIGIRNMISVNASTAGCTSQVNGSVAQLDQMTRQNAGPVEQSAAVAESLKNSHRLAQVVGTFRLETTVSGLPST